MERVPVYPNLEGEIARRGIMKSAIAKSIGISYKSYYNKMTGICDFTWPEVNIIQRCFFPDKDKDYLFATEKDPVRRNAENT